MRSHAAQFRLPRLSSGRIDLDLVFSLCALFISAIAAAASLYQLHMASSSIAAQTWPYVTAGWSYGNSRSGIVISNDGLGPALIRNVVLKVDGRPQRDALEAVSHLIDISHGPKGEIHMDALVPGAVIRPGSSTRLFDIGGAKWDAQLRAAQSRIELEVCYCSVLDRCWTSSTREFAQSIARCPNRDSSSLSLPASENTLPPVL